MVQNLQSKFDNKEIVKILTTAANQAELKAKKTKKDFLKSDTQDIATFQKEYIEQRALYHKR